MADGKVRTLCAKIAVELDPQKSAALVEELTEIILREYLKVGEASDQQLGPPTVGRKLSHKRWN